MATSGMIRSQANAEATLILFGIAWALASVFGGIIGFLIITFILKKKDSYTKMKDGSPEKDEMDGKFNRQLVIGAFISGIVVLIIAFVGYNLHQDKLKTARTGK